MTIATGFSYCVFDFEINEHDDDNANTEEYYQGGFLNTAWSTFTALTSSSYPSQFMGLDIGRIERYALYFVPVVVVGGFIILEGSIGFINNAYSVSNNNLMKALVINREGVMKDIFDILRHESGVRLAEETVLSKLMEKMEKDGVTEADKMPVSSTLSSAASDSGEKDNGQRVSKRPSHKIQTLRCLRGEWPQI